MKTIYDKLRHSEEITQLLKRVESNSAKSVISGVTGSFGSFITASLVSGLERPVLLVMPTPTLAERMLDDLTTIIGSERIGFIPPSHLYPFDTAPLANGPRNERIDALLRIDQELKAVYVTQPETLLEKGPDYQWLKENKHLFRTGADCRRDSLIAELAEAGYVRENLVDSQGQIAVRGGLIDLFPFGHEQPVRLEFDEDRIVSIRRFDSVNQRSVKKIDQVAVLIGDEMAETRGGLLELLPSDSVLVWYDMEDIDDRIKRFQQRTKEITRKKTSINSTVSDRFRFSTDQVLTRANDFPQVMLTQLPGGRKIDISFHSHTPDPFPGRLDQLPEYMSRYLDEGFEVWVTADTEGEKNRLEEFLLESKLDLVQVTSPTLSGGFVHSRMKLALLTTHELFARRRMRAHHTRFRRRAVQFDRSSLQRGDLVVHVDYGIGLFEGLQTVKVQGQPRECLRIRYQENVILYIRIEHFGLVEKYTGSETSKPALSRIGTSEWSRTKKRTRKALQDIAEELVKLYAQRMVIKGHAFPTETLWQKEMEASFEFDDTPDQVTSSGQIKADLEAEHPMDRLLCGDVGFGKTEVAVRAAFKVVQDSRQVAVLVPTTILAQQHYETFRQRLSSYPVRIEVLSRFRTPAEQRETITDLKSGKVDIVIGTHRLLSRDLGFKNLGMLIIDEEHRFGVRHKERLKQIKTNVDVLSMSATPIPRTLHLALMGAKDTSQINTPPVDRLPIQTEVYPWSEQIIRDAILREVDRQGQVFFVHNRIQSIYAIKSLLERLVPGLNYAVGHGQMKERELEKVMYEFMHGRYDVLISTMIIESGLDIPNVNTMIVNRADMFGLAQLYQLRGRIGRSNRQAYAYLLTPPKLVMTPDARRRLTTLSELTELGSGFKVAMRDLEIRGAGNLLGAQQSGFINAVGFDLYTSMLEEAVKKLKKDDLDKEEPEVDEEVRVDFKGPAILPASYIDNSDLRYYFYRSLARALDNKEIDQIEEEMIDRFGEFPDQTRNLLNISRLKIMGRILRFNRIMVSKKFMLATLDLPDDPADSQKYIGKLVAQADPETVEFKTGKNVDLVYRINSVDPLKQSRKFLLHLTRKGILLD